MAGREALCQLQDQTDLQDTLKQWTSVFNGMSVIGNRETPCHRDNNSRAEWYDLLATIGPYRSAIMELPGIGLRVRYDPGTVMGLSGKIVLHGVAECDGERVCYAYYMRDTIHERGKVEVAEWMKKSRYDVPW